MKINVSVDKQKVLTRVQMKCGYAYRCVVPCDGDVFNVGDIVTIMNSSGCIYVVKLNSMDENQQLYTPSIAAFVLIGKITEVSLNITPEE